MLEVLCEVLGLFPKKSETFRLILAAIMLIHAYLLIPWKGMINKPFKFRVATDRSAIRWKTYCSSS